MNFVTGKNARNFNCPPDNLGTFYRKSIEYDDTILYTGKVFYHKDTLDIE